MEQFSFKVFRAGVEHSFTGGVFLEFVAPTVEKLFASHFLVQQDYCQFMVLCQGYDALTHFMPLSLSMPLENSGKPEVF